MKSKLSVFILILCGLFLSQCGQQEVINYRHSYIESSNINKTSNKEFYNFGASIDNLDINKVLFIGDSHIANDMMSSFFRTKLHASSKLNNFITPKYQLNSALKMEQSGFDKMLLKDRELGINLTTYMCKDNASVRFLNDDIKNPSIFIRFVDENASVTIKQNDEVIRVLKAKDTQKWQKITLELSGSFELFANGKIYFAGIENSAEKYVDNLGVNGASLAWWYYTNEELFKMQVSDFDYDMAFISFGTNEAINPHTNINDYKKNLIKLIDIFKKSNTKVVLLSPHYSVYYSDGEYIKAPLYEEVKSALMDIAKEQGVMLYDMNAFMENMGGKDTMIELGYSQKDTHLSLNGYYEVGSRLYKNIRADK